MIGQWIGLIIDAPEPQVLAGFYEELLGLTRVEDSAEWVTLAEGGRRPTLAFQRVADYRAPQWPSSHHSQQMHLDVLVDNLDNAQARVLAIAATLLEGSDKPIGYRVYADPVGHPFCLVTPQSVGWTPTLIE